MNPEVILLLEKWVNFIASPVPLYFVALLGMFSHFLKKNMRGETATDIRAYFSDHVASTLNAFIWVNISYFIYITNIYNTGGVLDVMAVYTLGYTFDSLMNRYSENNVKKD